MKLFDAEHDDDDTDDKPFFKRSEVVHQEFKYPPRVPEEFIPTEDLPSRSRKGKEVAAGSRDPRASKKTIPSPAQHLTNLQHPSMNPRLSPRLLMSLTLATHSLTLKTTSRLTCQRLAPLQTSRRFVHLPPSL